MMYSICNISYLSKHLLVVLFATLLFINFLLPAVKCYLPPELQVTAPKGSTKILTGVAKKAAVAPKTTTVNKTRAEVSANTFMVFQELDILE